jgi:hypothetical protein
MNQLWPIFTALLLLVSALLITDIFTHRHQTTRLLTTLVRYWIVWLLCLITFDAWRIWAS